MPGYLTVAGIAAAVTFLLTFVDALGRAPHRRDRDARAAERPHQAHAVARRGGDVRRVPRRAWRWRRSSASSTRSSPTTPRRSACCSPPRSCSWSAPSTTCATCRRRRRSPGQVLSGSVLSLLGVTMLYFRVPFASYEYVVLSPDLAPLVTVLTVVVMANAINLIDGLDGLACGIVIIAGAAMFLYADRLFKAGLLEGSNMGPLVAAITVGICVGFLPHNFNPARHLHGRRRRDVPRAAPRHHHDHGRRSHRRPLQWPDLLLLRAPGHPAGDPRACRSSTPRSRSCAGCGGASRSRRPTTSTSTTA